MTDRDWSPAAVRSATRIMFQFGETISFTDDDGSARVGTVIDFGISTTSAGCVARYKVTDEEDRVHWTYNHDEPRPATDDERQAYLDRCRAVVVRKNAEYKAERAADEGLS